MDIPTTLRALTVIIALGTAIIGLCTYISKLRDERRTAVWERLQWALAHAWSDDPRKSTIGWLMLEAVVDDGIRDARDESVAHAALRFLAYDDQEREDTTAVESEVATDNQKGNSDD